MSVVVFYICTTYNLDLESPALHPQKSIMSFTSKYLGNKKLYTLVCDKKKV
jgi:hypothetical protein